jgi:hypothetical protein
MEIGDVAGGVINTMDLPSRLGIGDRPTNCHRKKNVKKPEGGEGPHGTVVASKKKKKEEEEVVVYVRVACLTLLHWHSPGVSQNNVKSEVQTSGASFRYEPSTFF